MSCAPTLARLCRLLTKSPALDGTSKPVQPMSPSGADRPRPPDARRLRPTRERILCQTAKPSLDELIARLSALHPKAHRSRARSDAPRCWPARSSRTQAAAGDPCRRHQRQGLDHRLSARDPGGRGPARPRLHLALSGAHERMLSPRPRRWRGAGQRRRIARRALERCERVNAGEPDRRCSRSKTAAAFPAVRAKSGRCRAARSRPRRPARRHQRGRYARSLRDRAGQHGSHGIPWAHADFDRRREGRDHQARRAR